MLKPPAYTYEDKEQDFSTREDKHRDSGYWGKMWKEEENHENVKQ
jgi:hypothetical protein